MKPRFLTHSKKRGQKTEVRGQRTRLRSSGLGLRSSSYDPHRVAFSFDPTGRASPRQAEDRGQKSDGRRQKSARPLVAETASLIANETEVFHEGKFQITSTKLQINLKFQNPMTETQFHSPGAEGSYGIGSKIQ